MFIKNWNSYDMSVYKINPRIKKAIIQKIFNSEERGQLRQIGKEFMDKLGVEFAHNLVRGWENKILQSGRVLSSNGCKELKIVAEVKKEMSEYGEVQFFSRKKLDSLGFIETIKKPVKDCWD